MAADALVTAPLARGVGGWRWPRLFATTKDEPRARRATDREYRSPFVSRAP